jgi:hypothetical protein
MDEVVSIAPNLREPGLIARLGYCALQAALSLPAPAQGATAIQSDRHML